MLTSFLRELPVVGRGDDARGRNLQALLVLEHASRRRWLSFSPHREPGRWLIMLLDLLGEGIPAEVSLSWTFAEFKRWLQNEGLEELAKTTASHTRRGFARKLLSSERVAEKLLPPLALKATLWHLGFDPMGYRRQVNWEKHSQGKLIRRKIAEKLDPLWRQVLEHYETAKRETASKNIDFVDVLAAIPPSFFATLKVIEAVLKRSDDTLANHPFAVYYALATDAVRGGRVWNPPAALVETDAYRREDFEAAVGRRLVATRSRKRREVRSVVLAELGLSASFPSTIALLDRWLEDYLPPELFVTYAATPVDTSDWLEHVASRKDYIEALSWELHDGISRLVTRESGEG